MTRRNPDPENSRAARKWFRKNGMSDPVYEAYNLGSDAAYNPRLKGHGYRCNPYPPGRRHDEWERGYKTADPLGDWHGRNY